MVVTTVESLQETTAGGLLLNNNIFQQLRLDLGASSDLVGLTQHVKTLRTARCVYLGSEDDVPGGMIMSEPDWSRRETKELFTAISSLQGVEELHLNDLGITFGPHGPRFPVTLLTHLLQKSCCLKKLVLSVRLGGNEETLEDFCKALKQQDLLCHLEWEEWCFPNIIAATAAEDNPTTNQMVSDVPFDFNPILDALSTLPKLESLSIRAMTASGRGANLGVLKSEALIRFCQPQKSAMRQLQLVHFQLHSKTVAAMSKALQKNDTLELLSLDSSGTKSDGALALFDMLRYNQRIEQFQIWASTNCLDWDKNQCVMQLANALESNRSVKSVAVMTHSRTILDILRGRKLITDGIAGAFVRMLESNYTLETLILDDYGKDEKEICQLSSMMLFFLALNGSGQRQKLLEKCESFTRYEWTELLGTMGQNAKEHIQLDVMYYFLKLNPSLCKIE